MSQIKGVHSLSEQEGQNWAVPGPLTSGSSVASCAGSLLAPGWPPIPPRPPPTTPPPPVPPQR